MAVGPIHPPHLIILAIPDISRAASLRVDSRLALATRLAVGRAAEIIGAVASTGTTTTATWPIDLAATPIVAVPRTGWISVAAVASKFSGPAAAGRRVLVIAAVIARVPVAAERSGRAPGPAEGSGRAPGPAEEIGPAQDKGLAAEIGPAQEAAAGSGQQRDLAAVVVAAATPSRVE